MSGILGKLVKRQDKDHRSKEEEKPTKGRRTGGHKDDEKERGSKGKEQETKGPGSSGSGSSGSGSSGSGSSAPVIPSLIPVIGTEMETLFTSTTVFKQKELLRYQLHIGGLNVKGVMSINSMSGGEITQRLHALIAPPLYGLIIDLKVHGAGDIAQGLERIAATQKSDGPVGEDVKDTLRKVAGSIVERRSQKEKDSELTNPDQLYKLFVDQTTGKRSTNYILPAFGDSRYNITWQTEDGLPTVNPTDINKKEEIAKHLMRQIFHRVQTVLSPQHWDEKAVDYRQRMMDTMDAVYMNTSKSEHLPKLPSWFESKDGKTEKFLEEKFKECQVRLEKKKTKTKKAHDTDKCTRKACTQCVRPSNSKNMVYFWTVDLGEHLSTNHGIRCRSYAGKATGGNLCKDRWGAHFKASRDLIDLLAHSTSLPGSTPNMQLVDWVLALAIVEDFKSALYCIDIFEGAKEASEYESKVIVQLDLKHIAKGLNVIS